jgi:hypothetical protein
MEQCLSYFIEENFDRRRQYMSDSKITMGDSVLDILTKMSDGNPGAVVALSETISRNAEVDPDALMGSLNTLMLLDTWGIYGADIHVLYKDKCGCDVVKMIMLVRATQLGLFPHERLKELASDHMYKINLSEEEMKDLHNQVCERLENFARSTYAIEGAE